MPCTSVKRDVSPGNNFALEDKLLEKSFIWIKNNNDPRMES